MHEVQGNMFDELGRADMLCVTTNGFVKRNGHAVMGRGCARTARDMWPGVELQLGEHITLNGNTPCLLGSVDNTEVWSFPVKEGMGICRDDSANVVAHMRSDIGPGENVPGWALVASLSLIRESARLLKAHADGSGFNRVVIPRAGCGAGELTWDTVSPVLREILDDRFYVYTF